MPLWCSQYFSEGASCGGRSGSPGQVAAQAVGSGFGPLALGGQLGRHRCLNTLPVCSRPQSGQTLEGEPRVPALGVRCRAPGSAGVEGAAGAAGSEDRPGRTPLCREPVSALREKTGHLDTVRAGRPPSRALASLLPSPSLFEWPQALGPCPWRTHVNSWRFSTQRFARCPQSLNSHEQMATAWGTLTWSPRPAGRGGMAVPLAPWPRDPPLGPRGSRCSSGASASLHPSRGHAAASRSDLAPPVACQQRPRRLRGAGLCSAESKRGTQHRGSRPPRGLRDPGVADSASPGECLSQALGSPSLPSPLV